MAKNYVEEGKYITLDAPYDLVAGAGAQIGSLFGVALDGATSGSPVVLATEGVFNLTKTSAQAWTVGVRVYWNNTSKEATTTATGNTLIGVALEAAVNPSPTGVVRLNGSF